MAGHIPDSLSVDWCTPDEIVEGVHDVFGDPPELDPCSNAHSRVGAQREFQLARGEDGLVLPWSASTAYVNPPFGYAWYKYEGVVHDCAKLACPEAHQPRRRRYIFAQQYKKLSAAEKKTWIRTTITDWVKLCALKAPFADIIGLIPAYPGTATWQDYVWPAASAVFFPRGRLSFRLPPALCTWSETLGCTSLATWRGEHALTCDEHKPLAAGKLAPYKDGPAPMDCALVLWGDEFVENFANRFADDGKVIVLS